MNMDSNSCLFMMYGQLDWILSFSGSICYLSLTFFWVEDVSDNEEEGCSSFSPDFLVACRLKEEMKIEPRKRRK